jgi:uncharacterized membrane protein
MIPMIKISTIKPELIFLFFCLIFGFIFAVIIPPFSVPDEGSHLFKAYDVSQGHLTPKSKIISVPKTVSNIIGSYIFIPNLNLKKEYISDLNKHLNVNDTQRVDISNVYTSSFVPYLGVASVIKICEFFDLSPLILMYFGRLINY